VGVEPIFFSFLVVKNHQNVTIFLQREHFSQTLFIIIGKVAKIHPNFSCWEQREECHHTSV
jgi:hypothetical protein